METDQNRADVEKALNQGDAQLDAMISLRGETNRLLESIDARLQVMSAYAQQHAATAVKVEDAITLAAEIIQMAKENIPVIAAVFGGNGPPKIAAEPVVDLDALQIVKGQMNDLDCRIRAIEQHPILQR